jgi:hypothetical protein
MPGSGGFAKLEAQRLCPGGGTAKTTLLIPNIAFGAFACMVGVVGKHEAERLRPSRTQDLLIDDVMGKHSCCAALKKATWRDAFSCLRRGEALRPQCHEPKADAAAPRPGNNPQVLVVRGGVQNRRAATSTWYGRLGSRPRADLVGPEAPRGSRGPRPDCFSSLASTATALPARTAPKPRRLGRFGRALWRKKNRTLGACAWRSQIKIADQDCRLRAAR